MHLLYFWQNKNGIVRILHLSMWCVSLPHFCLIAAWFGANLLSCVVPLLVFPMVHFLRCCWIELPHVPVFLKNGYLDLELLVGTTTSPFKMSIPFPTTVLESASSHTLPELDIHLLNLCSLGYYWGWMSVVIGHLYLVFVNCLFIFCIYPSLGIFLFKSIYKDS